MKKKLKKSLKLTTHIFGAITDKLLSVWCCLFFSGIAASYSSLRQQNLGRPISFQFRTLYYTCRSYTRSQPANQVECTKFFGNQRQDDSVGALRGGIPGSISFLLLIFFGLLGRGGDGGQCQASTKSLIFRKNRGVPLLFFQKIGVPLKHQFCRRRPSRAVHPFLTRKRNFSVAKVQKQQKNKLPGGDILNHLRFEESSKIKGPIYTIY